MTAPSPRFRLLAVDSPPRELEEEMLTRWRADDTVARALAQHPDGPPYVFFDGPPTANGRPGIHHVFARTVKDLFCRHRSMRGHWVPRKAGWDTHGLPVEIEVEKALGISGKPQIEAYGVERFNERCRESVWKYKSEWERLVERVAHWMDYDAPYVTYTNAYIESEWWALKTLFDRQLLYRGHKILPYCARCGTSLSSHEVAQGYEDVEDPSIYVAMDLATRGEGRGARGAQPVRRRLIVWTTTPWTLVSNVALAVKPELEYVELRKKSATDWTIILAEARAAAVLGADYTDRWDVELRMTGADLVGQRYARPFDWVAFEAGKGRHEVIVAGDFVSAEDGSGIVHLAPAFGAEDYAAGQQHGLVMLQPVNARGEFDAAVPVVGGRWVKDADPIIIDELRKRDALWKDGRFVHAYPHCWRCKTPLLYMARTSWFVRTTQFKDRMLERNGQVDWHPREVGEGRFGEWLRNNIDWAVSRSRYWGTPLPLWVCENNPDHIEAIGSYGELAERSGRALPEGFDPHKPFIDSYTWPCAACRNLGGGTPNAEVPVVRRVPEVIDAWFDSGSMPFAQWHYPFENRDRVEREFPADFIAEGLDQTRGWFYSLLAIATGLGDALPNNAGPPEPASPYRAVVVNDLVLDMKGVKMSKSKGNVVDPFEVVDRHGADAVRLFLVAASQLGVPRRFDESVIRETAARFLLTLKNVYSGIFAQYANFGWAPSAADPALADRPLIDRWVLSRTATVERDVDALLSAYDATAAARRLMGFVVDDVSNWYVRLNRHRFFEVEESDNRAAFATLHEVLTVCMRLLAPFAPYVSDWVHRELTGESVHLAPYVRPQPGERLEQLELAMEEARELVTLGRAAREEAGINVRRPLARMLCVVPPALVEALQPLLPLVRTELNVKELTLLTSADQLVTLQAKANFRALGKKFGKHTPLAAKAVEALASEDLRAFEGGTPLAITVEGESRHLDPDDLSIVRKAAGELVVKEAGGRFAALDPAITPALRKEGLARELVSRVQRLRKDAGFAVSDRVRLWIVGAEEIEGAAAEYQDWIGAEVLARVITIHSLDAGVEHAAQTVAIDGLTVRIALTVDN